MSNELTKILSTGDQGVLATIKRDGRPQLSVVNYALDAEAGVIRVSVTDDRAKTRNLRRDPRASLHVTAADGASWVAVEGVADLSPIAESTDDTTVQELVDHYRAVWGEHPDWDGFRAAMVRDRRAMLRLPIERLYGQPPIG